jgi:O-antigen ligase/polysaccharide polymerase Wzy-like membrane protein
MFRNLALLSLLTHMVATAATQTAFGNSFSQLRWVSLFALTVLGAVAWITSPQRDLRLLSVNMRVAAYSALWGLTVIYSEHAVFAGYRLVAHLMIVVFGLVFLPQLLRLTDAPRMLTILKLIIGIILVVSYFRPAPLTIYDDPDLYKGILGNANTLGHMSAVGCLLFFHGYLTGSDTRWGRVQAGLAGLAALLMMQSGARSSLAAFVAGLFMLCFLYRERLSRHLVLMLLAGLAVIALVPNVPQRISDFAFKHRVNVEFESTLDHLTFSRQEAWERSWDGFMQKPILGWGFGLDSDADLSNWMGAWTSLGVTGRDPVNDVMSTLESGGVVGLVAYVAIMALLSKGWFPLAVRTSFDGAVKQPEGTRVLQMYEAQKAYFCLSLMLIVLFEFDNTALAAGSFFAALLWVSLGLCVGFRALLMAGIRRSIPIGPLHEPALVYSGR